MDVKTKNKLSQLVADLKMSDLTSEQADFLDNLDKALLSNKKDIDDLIRLLEAIERNSAKETGLTLIINYLKGIEHDLDEEAGCTELIGD